MLAALPTTISHEHSSLVDLGWDIGELEGEQRLGAPAVRAVVLRENGNLVLGNGRLYARYFSLQNSACWRIAHLNEVFDSHDLTLVGRRVGRGRGSRDGVCLQDRRGEDKGATRSL